MMRRGLDRLPEWSRQILLRSAEMALTRSAPVSIGLFTDRKDQPPGTVLLPVCSSLVKPRIVGNPQLCPGDAITRSGVAGQTGCRIFARTGMGVKFGCSNRAGIASGIPGRTVAGIIEGKHALPVRTSPRVGRITLPCLAPCWRVAWAWAVSGAWHRYWGRWRHRRGSGFAGPGCFPSGRPGFP